METGITRREETAAVMAVIMVVTMAATTPITAAGMATAAQGTVAATGVTSADADVARSFPLPFESAR
jgi:hypothetical protein